jgi:hypothetical protein
MARLVGSFAAPFHGSSFGGAPAEERVAEVEPNPECPPRWIVEALDLAPVTERDSKCILGQLLRKFRVSAVKAEGRDQPRVDANTKSIESLIAHVSILVP